MPIVRVYGVPESTKKKHLAELVGAIQDQIAEVKKLEVYRDQVSVFFPRDLFQAGLGEEICVFIAIYGKPERTDEILYQMADRVQRKINKDFFPSSLVEVIPQVVNSEHCSSSEGITS